MQVVAFYQIKWFYKARHTPTSANLQGNHLLVLNLAVADILMGIYLTLLGANGIKFSGIYCSVSIKWLSSPTCNIMGVLAVLSSETSVATLVMLTALRLYSILKVYS